MAPSTHRGYRPTRRDLYVACFSAACTLLWAHFLATDNLSALLSQPHGDKYWEVKEPVGFPVKSAISPSPTPIPPPASTVKKPKLQSQIMPSTEIIAHGDGWTLFDNLYMFNGTLLVISDEGASSFPEPRMITSTGESDIFDIANIILYHRTLGLPAENVEGNLEGELPISESFAATCVQRI